MLTSVYFIALTSLCAQVSLALDSIWYNFPTWHRILAQALNVFRKNFRTFVLATDSIFRCMVLLNFVDVLNMADITMATGIMNKKQVQLVMLRRINENKSSALCKRMIPKRQTTTPTLMTNFI